MAYASGIAEPVSVLVDTFGTGKIAEDALSAAVRKVFDLRPAAIIDGLQLRRPVFQATAAYGHFGRDDFTWEALNMVDALRNEV